MRITVEITVTSTDPGEMVTTGRGTGEREGEWMNIINFGNFK